MIVKHAAGAKSGAFGLALRINFKPVCKVNMEFPVGSMIPLI